MKLSNLGLLRTQLTLSRQRLVQRRTYADHAVHTPVTKSSDTPWVIGATAVFGPTLAYLLTPTQSAKSHHLHAPSIPAQKSTPVEDKYTRSFEESEIPLAGSSEVLDSSPAGEGRPHGEGDKALRQMVKSTDIHSHKQVNTGGLHEQKAIPEKMDEARSNSAKRGVDPDVSLDTKTVVAKAKTAHQDKQANS